MHSYSKDGTLLPWVEKYRPNCLSAIISHREIINTICRFIDNDQLPHLLLHGPPGTGKTSTIKAIAQRLYGEYEKAMVLELNASDDRGIKVVRGDIKTFAESSTTTGKMTSKASYFRAAASSSSTSSSAQRQSQQTDSQSSQAPPSSSGGGAAGGGGGGGGEVDADMDMAVTQTANTNTQPKSVASSQHSASLQQSEDKTNNQSSINKPTGRSSLSTRIKMVVLDEADQMTSVAQMALRRIMENYADRVRFCIVCNYVNKINPALQSRCTKFRFPPIPIDDMKSRTMEIASEERINLSATGCSTLAELSGGDMRKVVNVLQAAALSHGSLPHGDRMEDIKDEDAGASADESKKKISISAQDILECVGKPLKDEISGLFKLLVEATFAEAFDGLMEIQARRGYSVADLLAAIYEKSLKIDWPNITMLSLLPRLADIEYRLSLGADESIQTSCLVAAFVEARINCETLKWSIKVEEDSQ
eukprot:Selendium_serpulae@DN5122_c1_g1_i1.p1